MIYVIELDPTRWLHFFCTICEMQIACNFINILRNGSLYEFTNWLFCNKGPCLLCMQTTRCMAEYFTTAGYFLQNIIISYRICYSTTEYCRFVSTFCAYQRIKMLNKYHIHSHQHCPLPVLCSTIVEQILVHPTNCTVRTSNWTSVQGPPGCILPA